MSKIKKLLGQRIREIRKARGITQEQLAEMVGIGTSNISYIETGRFAPSSESFEKIVEALEVEPHQLYMFSPLKPIEEMRADLIAAMDKDEELLKLMYKFYLALR